MWQVNDSIDLLDEVLDNDEEDDDTADLEEFLQNLRTNRHPLFPSFASTLGLALGLALSSPNLQLPIPLPLSLLTHSYLYS